MLGHPLISKIAFPQQAAQNSNLEVDGFHTYIDYLSIWDSFLGVKVLNCVIYTPIYSIMLGFCL